MKNYIYRDKFLFKALTTIELFYPIKLMLTYIQKKTISLIWKSFNLVINFQDHQTGEDHPGSIEMRIEPPGNKNVGVINNFPQAEGANAFK